MSPEEKRAYGRRHYQENRDAYLARAKARQDAMKEEKREYDKARRAAKGAELRAYDAARRNTPGRVAKKREWSRRRSMISDRACPAWLSEDDKNIILSIYELAAIYTAAGHEAQVDHIIPMRGKAVCGLHVPGNLTCVPELVNRRKRNHFELAAEAYQ